MKLSIFSFFIFLSMIVVGCTKWDLDKVSIQATSIENPPSTSPTPTPTPTPTPSPTPNPAPSPITNDLNKVFFSSNQIGYIAGNKMVLKTTNGGTTWSKIKESSTIEFTAIYFVDDNNGFVGGNDQFYNFVFVTSDGGGTWKQINSHVSDFNERSKVSEILYINNVIYYFVNDYPNISQVYGWVYYSSDNGVGWKRISVGRMQGVNCVSYNGSTILIGGSAYWESSKYISSTWSILNLDLANWIESRIGIDESINGISLLNNKAIAVGDAGSFSISADKGTNWTSKTIPNFSSISFKAAKIIDDLNFYIAGDNGTLLKTSDGGLNWTPITTTGKYSLNGFSLKPNGELYLVGENGQILKVK